MTLDNNLDLLKSLKGLRWGSLQQMEIYIDGEREQNCFAEHWSGARIEVKRIRGSKG